MAEPHAQPDAMPQPIRSWWVPLLATALPFGVYLRTMAPTVYGLDSAELTTGAYVLGIVHGPGSPLFLLLAHAFTWLPIGDVGYRVNLLSACAAAGAVGFVAAILRRLTRDAVVAVAGAWLLAFTYYFWVMALAAELYALHACFIAALLWLALLWRDHPRPWLLWVFAFLFGLGLGNHLSLSLLMPGFAYLVLREPAARPARVLAGGVVCGLIGASVYLYLPARSLAGTPLNYARNAGVDVATWHGFWWMVRGGMFESRFFAVPYWRLPTELALFTYRLWSNFLGLGCLVGILGLIDTTMQPRSLRLALALMFLGHLTFVTTYAVLDKELMLVPTFMIWGIWVALGAFPAAQLVRAWTGDRVRLSAGMVVIVLSLSNLVVNFGYTDISDDRSARESAEAILGSLAPSAVLIGTWAEVPVIEYLQLVEGQRPDVETVNLFFLTGDPLMTLVRGRLAADRSVYTTVPGLFQQRGAQLEYLRRCNCYRVIEAPEGPRAR